MRIGTWNSCGNKRYKYLELLDEYNLDVLCIQEAGDPFLLGQPKQRLKWNLNVETIDVKYNGKKYIACYWKNSIFQNCRTSLLTYIKINKSEEIFYDLDWYQYSNDDWFSKPMLWIQYEGIGYGNVHGSNDYDAPKIRNYYAQNNSQGYTLGDFNCGPNAEPPIDNNLQIIDTGEATQISGHNLDYLIKNINNPNINNARLGEYNGSDHKFVYFE